MPKKGNHKSSGGDDGRRHNQTPVHSRVKPGQVLNPNGRRGKRQTDAPTALDLAFLEEGRRVVSRQDDRDITAMHRLVQEEFQSALRHNDTAVRGRLLARYQEADIRQSREDREYLEHVFARKAELSEQFYRANRAGATPPDILPHPDHVVFENGWPVIRGPIDHEGRRAWEHIKACIRIVAHLLKEVRAEQLRNPTQEAATQLAALKKWRAKLMRRVPKGWSWSELIYCRDSLQTDTDAIISELREIGYVPAAD